MNNYFMQKTIVFYVQEGKCLEECKTVQRACEEAIGDVDTDIGKFSPVNTERYKLFKDLTVVQ